MIVSWRRGLFEAHARPRVARSRGGARAAEVNECEQLPSVLSDTREASAVDSSACSTLRYEIAASDFDLAMQVAMWSWEFKQGILSYRGEGSMYDTRTSASRAPESQSRPRRQTSVAYDILINRMRPTG